MPVDISQVTQEELAQVAAEVTNQASSNQQKRKVVEAAANELSTEEQEALAIRIYENATGGRFPQNSIDRRLVFQWGIGAMLLGLLTALVALVWVLVADKDTEPITAIATLVLGGIVGGLFGVTTTR